MFASTVAQTDLLSGSSHSFQTAFMGSKSVEISLSQIEAVNRLDFDVPALARKSSILASTSVVCPATTSNMTRLGDRDEKVSSMLSE